MEKKILVINIGSSSKKYSLYSGDMLVLDAHFEKDKSTFAVTYSGEEAKEISTGIYNDSLASFYDTLKHKGYIREDDTIDGIGMRLVAPGKYFTEDRVIDEVFLRKLASVVGQDLVHVKALQIELRHVRELFGDTKMIAISDSSFHSTMSETAKSYALPQHVINECGVSRFGFHGISLSSIVTTLSSRPLGLEKKAIICHLGSGASMTAVLEGKSIDTSMGYSPLEGLIMSSRIGNIDVGAVLHIAEKHTLQDIQKILYTQSGLLAISGLSDDMRVLIDAEKEGHVGAHKAIEAFVYAIRKYIGAYASVLGGVDLIVFSGTIGERSFILRDRICSNFDWLNIHLDSEKNVHAKSGDYINKEGGVGLCVVHTDEDFEIMKKTKAFAF